MFAFRDGIIDDKCIDGGICFNELGAYAVVLTDADEEKSPSPDEFTYKCQTGDRGRFRLTAADFRSRNPVRVLRSNNLSSLWAPRAGLRYDGLYVCFCFLSYTVTNISSATELEAGQFVPSNP